MLESQRMPYGHTVVLLSVLVAFKYDHLFRVPLNSFCRTFHARVLKPWYLRESDVPPAELDHPLLPSNEERSEGVPHPGVDVPIEDDPENDPHFWDPVYATQVSSEVEDEPVPNPLIQFQCLMFHPRTFIIRVMTSC